MDETTLTLVAEIDHQFAAMSEPGNDDKWTDEAVMKSPEWASQRERARAVLEALGEPRADADVGSPRPGGPIYVTGARRDFPASDIGGH